MSKLAIRPYTRGLHDLGDGLYAWLQPDGGWGWSNAGLIVDGEESLLVDTLFDLRLTADMLTAMKGAEPLAASNIGTLVNTHANGDHCNGNELVSGAEIISSEITAEEMRNETPQLMVEYLKAAPDLGEMGEYFVHCFGDFEFEGITQCYPTTTYQHALQRKVGDKAVELIEVGPAHTGGDTLVYVEQDKTVFTGDILFIEGHPLMWNGPVGNWIAACNRMLAMDLETVVPGHGPVTDKKGVTAVRDYLQYISDEARKRFDAGLDLYDAAMDISLTDYSSWGDAERIVANVSSLYSEFSGVNSRAEIADIFALMTRIYNDKRRN
ncbi:MAG: MBL fold metallo-hydrolase [Halieaceae bacterium]|jgi:cyclase|nr:MBL fold metallo-hydrolase [Halieaceae bacterium]